MAIGYKSFVVVDGTGGTYGVKVVVTKGNVEMRHGCVRKKGYLCVI